jgi:hypothetical protein
MVLLIIQAMFTGQQWYYSPSWRGRGLKAMVRQKAMPALRVAWHEMPGSVEAFVGNAGDAEKISVTP